MRTGGFAKRGRVEGIATDEGMGVCDKLVLVLHTMSPCRAESKLADVSVPLDSTDLHSWGIVFLFFILWVGEQAFSRGEELL